jgi:CRP-like cAMP-binding protein
MKQTSLQANKAADQFKGSHKKIIMHFLDDEMTGKDIAEVTNLKFESVMRRMSELERENKVITKGSKKGFTIYKKK